MLCANGRILGGEFEAGKNQRLCSGTTIAFS